MTLMMCSLVCSRLASMVRFRYCVILVLSGFLDVVFLTILTFDGTFVDALPAFLDHFLNPLHWAFIFGFIEFFIFCGLMLRKSAVCRPLACMRV
jgi:hypothetical protein